MPKQLKADRIPERLTVQQASEFSELEESWLRRCCKKGSLPATKFGTGWVIEKADFLQFMGDHRPKGAARGRRPFNRPRVVA